MSLSTAAGDSRDEFIAAAKRLFAQRGFYGASIASIATELGFTKQALLHHFGTKEKLYGEVLAQISSRLAEEVRQARSADPDPRRQLESLLLKLYKNSVDHPDDARLLMRELLDNKGRSEQANSWYLKAFLDSLASMVRDIPNREALTEPQVLARLYQVLGAINYFAISEPTLRQMYGKGAYGRMQSQFPRELTRIMETFF